MRLTTLQRVGLVVLSAGLQLIIFPVAGPMPVWRSWLGWVALVPLLAAVLAPDRDGARTGTLRAAWLGYLCGVLWYAGNCYWIYQTMYRYGGMGKPAALGILVLFSFYLGLYHGLFTVLLALASRRGIGWGLAAAPFLWAAVELGRAHITSFPWDQMGMSQVDHAALTAWAPVGGVYLLSFLLVSVSAALTMLLLRRRVVPLLVVVGLCVALAALGPRVKVAAPDRAAVLLQPNGVEGDDQSWFGGKYELQMGRLAGLSERPPLGPPATGAADVIVWPESPAPLIEEDERFQHGAAQVAVASGSPLILGDVARTRGPDGRSAIFNSASFFNAQGQGVGRYDKVHLVPFGEYIPFQSMLTFAKALTAGAGDMTPGRERVSFRTGGHTYGVFICYESIFADEVRQFAKNGADVLVNISDDGWYGDTSAPWQHLNMARMRAIENRRWVLGDTNSGQTVSINPLGEVVAVAPAHVVTAIRVPFGFVTETTFYTRHGDWFAYAVTIVGLLMVAFAWMPRRLMADD